MMELFSRVSTLEQERKDAQQAERFALKMQVEAEKAYEVLRTEAQLV